MDDVQKEIETLESEIKSLDSKRFDPKTGNADKDVFEAISKKSARVKELRAQQQTEQWQAEEKENEAKQVEKQHSINAARKHQIYGGW
jgi:hypothetical protein